MSFAAAPYNRIDLFHRGLTVLDKTPTLIQLRKLINFSVYSLKYAGREPDHSRDVVCSVPSPQIDVACSVPSALIDVVCSVPSPLIDVVRSVPSPLIDVACSVPSALIDVVCSVPSVLIFK